ncbi:MAG: SGNH/GDSL hydrolase family protein [Ramlibacter sp.]|nr:SGNH/GDSL hydrolase family protein [Ramlibacter sp.]
MLCHWIRRGLLALASASVLLLAACGSGSIESQLQPSRVVVFGDGFSDVGQTGKRYTVNDNGVNVWTQSLAASFGITLVPAVSGGTAYATLNARVISKPDAVGNGATPTVAEQIDTFIAGNTFTANDLVVVSGGISDIIAEMAQLNAGAQTSEQMLADVRQAGRDLGAQVHRLVQAGATHVVVAGTYDLGKSPWATATSQSSLLSEASTKFNTELLVSIVDLGATTLYVDAALLYNLMYYNPGLYSMSNSLDPVCNSVDAGAGIGIGAGQVNSALCTTSTLVDPNYGLYLFADRVYPAAGHVKFGDYAYSRVRARW